MLYCMLSTTKRNGHTFLQEHKYNFLLREVNMRHVPAKRRREIVIYWGRRLSYVFLLVTGGFLR